MYQKREYPFVLTERASVEGEKNRDDDLAFEKFLNWCCCFWVGIRRRCNQMLILFGVFEAR
jgi:hypothetical protein